jgi:DNA invertase Pin-like site-specific DNA recombinase
MNVDTSTSQGLLLRHIMAAFAEYESDVKADYARASHRLARSMGCREACRRSARTLGRFQIRRGRS